jgi:hypothetical protein
MRLLVLHDDAHDLRDHRSLPRCEGPSRRRSGPLARRRGRRAISSRYLGPETAQAFVAERGEGVVVRPSASAAQVWDLSGILPVTTRSDGSAKR